MTDPFNPVKGILLAFALGIVLWAGIIGAAVYAFMALGGIATGGSASWV